MEQSQDSVGLYRRQHAILADAIVDKRDAVLNPNLDFDTDDFVRYLRNDVLPNLSHKEETLYAAVDEKAGTDLATATLRADIETIERRTDALASGTHDGASLPIELHELSALFVHHVETEDSVLLPTLEELFADASYTDILEAALEDKE